MAETPETCKNRYATPGDLRSRIVYPAV